MFSEMKTHVIIFVLMLSLLFGGELNMAGIWRKTLPPVSVSLAEDSFEEGEKAPGIQSKRKRNT